MWLQKKKSEERFKKLWIHCIFSILSILLISCGDQKIKTKIAKPKVVDTADQLNALIQSWDQKHWALEKNAQSLNRYIDSIWGRLRSNISSPLGINQIVNADYFLIPNFENFFVNLIIKPILLLSTQLTLVYKLKLVEDLNTFINRFLNRS